MAEIYFDRRVSEGLMAELKGSGFAHSLVQYARSGQYGLDLALRSKPGSKTSIAMLYVGTTKALDLRHHPLRGFRLTAPEAWIKATGDAWDPAWGKYRSGQELAKAWRDVEVYIERCIEAVAQTRAPLKDGSSAARRDYLKEGVVQAGISRFPHDGLVVIDREAVIGAISHQRLTEINAPLKEAIERIKPEEHKWLKLGQPSTECDALAIDDQGNLVAIEIKPEAVPAAALAPLQAWQYAQQIQAWIDDSLNNGTHDPRTILQGMYEQKRELGLLPPRKLDLTARPQAIPAVAMRRPKSKEIERRLGVVADLLAGDPALNQPAMRYYHVNLIGRLDSFSPTSVANS